jgi:hypothetical protein
MAGEESRGYDAKESEQWQQLLLLRALDETEATEHPASTLVLFKNILYSMVFSWENLLGGSRLPDPTA